MLLTETISSLGVILDKLGIRWALIGAFAANRYRHTPRNTGDVDLLLARIDQERNSLEQKLIDAGWEVRQADAEGYLMRLQHPKSGVADLLISGTRYQDIALARADRETIDSTTVYVLTAEDVIIHKLIAGRYQDLADIEAILEAEPTLDTAYLDEWIDTWDLGPLWKRLTESD